MAHGPVTGDIAHLSRLIAVDPSYPFNKPSVTCKRELILTVFLARWNDTNESVWRCFSMEESKGLLTDFFFFRRIFKKESRLLNSQRFTISRVEGEFSILEASSIFEFEFLGSFQNLRKIRILEAWYSIFKIQFYLIFGSCFEINYKWKRKKLSFLNDSSTIVPFPFLFWQSVLKTVDREKNSNFVRFHFSTPFKRERDKEELAFFLFTYRAAGGEIENTFRSFFIFKRKISSLHKPSWIVRYCSTPLSLSLPFSSLLLVCTVVAIKGEGTRAIKMIAFFPLEIAKFLSIPSFTPSLLFPSVVFRIAVLREIVHDCTILKQRNWWSSFFFSFFFCFDPCWVVELASNLVIEFFFSEIDVYMLLRFKNIYNFDISF